MSANVTFHGCQSVITQELRQSTGGGYYMSFHTRIVRHGDDDHSERVEVTFFFDDPDTVPSVAMIPRPTSKASA